MKATTLKLILGVTLFSCVGLIPTTATTERTITTEVDGISSATPPKTPTKKDKTKTTKKSKKKSKKKQDTSDSKCC